MLTENGFTISEPDAKLAEDLKAAGDKLFQDWKSRAGEEGQQLLERYRADLDT